MKSRTTPSFLLIPALALVAGCDRAAQTDATPSQATVAEVGAAVVAAAEAEAAMHPFCALATFDEIRAVVGGNISKVDVIDDPMSQSLDCVYLDPSDLYNGLTLRFTTTERLGTSGSQWSNAAAYVSEWTRSGDAVAGLGDAAAWIPMPSGLLLQKGDFALHLSASRADLTQTEVRAKFETLARQVIARLP